MSGMKFPSMLGPGPRRGAAAVVMMSLLTVVSVSTGAARMHSTPLPAPVEC